jgi:heat shock protein beta
VFINDKFDEMIPRWLKFIKGVVDSDDLPLNVGREILQKSKVLNIIRKRLIKKSLDMINEIAKDEDESKYILFWNNFGKYMKVGVVEDDLHRFEIAPLLRFFSSSSEEEYRSLEEYEAGMKEGQKSIYYITADSKAKASKSPILEKVTSKGYEVLYMVEPLDEICVQSLARFRDYDLVDITKEGLDFGEDADKEESQKAVEKLNEDFKPVLEYMETLLGGKIKKATMTTLLKSSPAALVQGEYGMSPSMQKYMKAQSVALGDSSMSMGNMNQAVLELNPDNPIVKDLQRMVEMEQDEKENFGMLIYDVAAMTSGYEIEDTGDFAQRVMKLMNSKAVADGADDEVKDAEIVE